MYSDRAVDLIENHATQHKDKPLFLYLAFTSNHFPIEAPVEYLDMYFGVDDSQKRRTSMAMTTHMDNVIGNVMRALEDTGLYENSIILLMGDNGAYSDKWDWLAFYGGGDNSPLRGQKGTQYEGATRVPALINSPLLNLSGRCLKLFSNTCSHFFLHSTFQFLGLPTRSFM